MLIQIRRDELANWVAKNPILASGEMGFEADTGKMKIGDGSKTWVELSYIGTQVTVREADLSPTLNPTVLVFPNGSITDNGNGVVTVDAIGQDGQDGSVWRNGNGPPNNSLGINGDYYLDDNNGDVYLKSSGTYSVVANIQGGVAAGYQQDFTGSSVVVNHNLGYRPNVLVLDTAGDECEGVIVHNSINQLTLTFSASFSGTVYCS
jgi:Major tropism determinant N-terminal domain